MSDTEFVKVSLNIKQAILDALKSVHACVLPEQEKTKTPQQVYDKARLIKKLFLEKFIEAYNDKENDMDILVTIITESGLNKLADEDKMRQERNEQIESIEKLRKLMEFFGSLGKH